MADKTIDNIGIETDNFPSFVADRAPGRIVTQGSTTQPPASGPARSVPLRQPLEIYPGMATEQKRRVETYILWPREKTGQDPLELADAGFFYQGVRDKVECQYCGLVLHNWNPGDVPLDEHRRYKPECRFIKQFV